MAFYKGQPDIIIRNGTIVDGTGKQPYYADIAVVGDKIDYIGNLKGARAPLEIDASHKYVTPGFIDSHTHSDATIWANPECQSAVHQGVTTEIVGNCGFSMRTSMNGLPFDPAGDGIDCIYNLPGSEYPKGSVAATLDKAEKMGASMNTAWLFGHNDLRIMVGCNTPEVSETQYTQMEGWIREAMEAGFIGFSTGLEFIPGILSSPKEVERLASVAAEYGAIYTTHMRDEGTYLLEAVNEFLNVIRATGMRGMVSHLNVKYDNGIPNEYLQRAMQMLKDARSVEHLNVYCDMLPTCFANGGASAILPPWLYADGWDKAREILADPAGRARVKQDCSRYWRFLADGQWDRLLYLKPPYLPEIAKRPFNEQARESGREPFDFFLDVLQQASTLEEATSVGMQGVMFHEQTMIDSVVRDPIYLLQTDSRVVTDSGLLAEGNRNIQNYMSMTYFFTRYVRELGVISIEDAVKKVGMMPAHHFRLEKRGVLEVGNYADINVFDLHALKVNATFESLNHYSTGMDYVIVNGVPVIVHDVHTGKRSGRVLRHLSK